MEPDHLILPVNDRDASISFYTEVLGLTHEGDDGPFAVIRVTPTFTIQMPDWGTDGGYHIAFAMEKKEFDATFARVRDAGVDFGDSYQSVGNQRGPGAETGARGAGKALYLFDTNRHLEDMR